MERYSNQQRSVSYRHERAGAPPHVNLIIRSEDTLVDILVDEIGDVLAPCKDEFESLPPTVRGRLSLSVRGVYKLRGELLWHLDIEGLLEDFSPVVSNLDPLDK